MALISARQVVLQIKFWHLLLLLALLLQRRLISDGTELYGIFKYIDVHRQSMIRRCVIVRAQIVIGTVIGDGRWRLRLRMHG